MMMRVMIIMIKIDDEINDDDDDDEADPKFATVCIGRGRLLWLWLNT